VNAAAHLKLRLRSGLRERPRVAAAFARSARYPVTIVTASAGAGKSVAIAQALSSEGCFLFTAGSQHDSLVRFARGLADALSPARPVLAAGFAAASESALRAAHPATPLAAWFAENLEPKSTLALDDLHRVEHQTDVMDFVARLVERSPNGVRWILGLRTAATLPTGAWLARRLAGLPIDDAVLALDASESREFALAFGPRDDAEIAELSALTSAHLGRFQIVLRAGRTTRAELRDLDAYCRTRAHCFFEGLPAPEQRLLFALAAAPALGDPVVRAIPGARALLERLEASVPCCFAGNSLVRFSEPVRLALADARNDDACDAHREMIGTLERRGRFADALRAAIDCAGSDVVLALLEAHGFALLDGTHGDLVREAAAYLPVAQRRASAVALALEAMSASDAGHNDISESWFRNAIALAGPTETGTRIAYALAVDLLQRGRLDCIDLLESLADLPASPVLRAQIAGRLGAAYALVGRWKHAKARITAALECLSAEDDAVTRAGIYQSAAFIALQERDPATARSYAQRSQALAEEYGQDKLAAVALSVSYAVALSYDDDIQAALAILDRFDSYASRLGSTFFRRYALFGRIEIAAECGDASALRAFDQHLASAEIENDVEHAQQALVPSNALRATWTGDFLGAYRALVTNADADRGSPWYALRWSEIALYAAAAGLPEAAAGALGTARKALPPLRNPSALSARARLNLALASALLGNRRAALAALSALGMLAGWPRLACYRDAIRSVIADPARNAHCDHILASFAALREAGFGGIAAMLEAVPAW